jgi:hypothetical protein
MHVQGAVVAGEHLLLVGEHHEQLGGDDAHDRDRDHQLDQREARGALLPAPHG